MGTRALARIGSGSAPRRRGLAAAAVLVGLALAGCAGGAELVVWDEPANYSYQVTVTGGDLPPRTWIIGVRDHEVATQVAPGFEHLDRYPVTLESGFTLRELLADYAITQAQDPPCGRVSFDPATGAPSRIETTWCSGTARDPLSYSIDAFEPESPDSAVATTPTPLTGDPAAPESPPWEEPADYTYDVSFGNDSSLNWLTITVRNHDVVEVAKSWGIHPFTLGDLVADYNEAVAENSGDQSIQFNPRTGVPSGFNFNPCLECGDGGIFYTVDAFDPEG